MFMARRRGIFRFQAVHAVGDSDVNPIVARSPPNYKCLQTGNFVANGQKRWCSYKSPLMLDTTKMQHQTSSVTATAAEQCQPNFVLLSSSLFSCEQDAENRSVDVHVGALECCTISGTPPIASLTRFLSRARITNLQFSREKDFSCWVFAILKTATL